MVQYTYIVGWMVAALGPGLISILWNVDNLRGRGKERGRNCVWLLKPILWKHHVFLLVFCWLKRKSVTWTHLTFKRPRTYNPAMCFGRELEIFNGWYWWLQCKYKNQDQKSPRKRIMYVTLKSMFLEIYWKL